MEKFGFSNVRECNEELFILTKKVLTTIQLEVFCIKLHYDLSNDEENKIISEIFINISELHFSTNRVSRLCFLVHTINKYKAKFKKLYKFI